MTQLRDVKDFPVGTHVITPRGLFGVVVAHRGAESKFDMYERCIVRYQHSQNRDSNTVTLRPCLLTPVDSAEL